MDIFALPILRKNYQRKGCDPEFQGNRVWLMSQFTIGLKKRYG